MTSGPIFCEGKQVAMLWGFCRRVSCSRCKAPTHTIDGCSGRRNVERQELKLFLYLAGSNQLDMFVCQAMVAEEGR